MYDIFVKGYGVLEFEEVESWINVWNKTKIVLVHCVDWFIDNMIITSNGEILEDSWDGSLEDWLKDN